MLNFYYDCIDKFIDRKNYELCNMDTDSFYFALGAETLDEIIKPEMVELYKREKDQWFPSTKTAVDAACTKRTPGLFRDFFFLILGLLSTCQV